MTFHSIILAVGLGALSLMGARAGELTFAEDHLAVTLPEGWQPYPEPRTNLLVRAKMDDGNLLFAFTKPPVTAGSDVKDVKFQFGIKKALRDQGFAKVLRSEVIKVAGADAYLCEASRFDEKSFSMLQVVWFHQGHIYTLVFLSKTKPFKDVADVQKIIQSVKAIKK